MNSRYPDAKSIFFEAIERSSTHEREEYLEIVCKNNADLRRRVEALLKSHDAAGDFLIISDSTLETEPVSEGTGTLIGRYKLLEKIGEGGMAVVYMAEQERPIRRKAALKIIKLGMDTKLVIARFEAERQALAMMDHPNIAKVLDAGATETGRPYFVMDLVTGLSITKYCDKNRLSIKERLKLFITVCDAIQHAHQKGIIHRDIKPSNIMVTMQNGRAVPKVIDFGISKATNQRLTEKTLFTRYAHIIGTPAYMSPEQAELSDLDVDTRTDIYSLGVLLYELLTGTTPFSEEKLREAGYLQMQKIICEEEPTKPSTKLSTLGEELTNVAKWHNSSPELLPKLIRGDLDWIVLKSLEKDRDYRYETPSALGADVQRHLEHEPVQARAPKTLYRLQKFVRRHRSKTIVALVMLTMAGVLTVILSMWNQDRLQLVETEGIRHKGILSEARDQYTEMDRDTALATIKPILNSRHVGPEAQLLYAGILVDYRRSDEAVTILDSLTNEPPEIAGAAYSLLARLLWESESSDDEKLKKIDEYRQKAEELLPETAEAYFLRAMTALTVKEQLALLDRALYLDPSHYESRKLRAFTYYASRKYEKMQLDVEAMITLRSKNPLGYSLRAIALRESGRYQEAIVDYDRAISLTAKDSTEYIDLSTQRSETLLRIGDYERVVVDAQECLNLWPDSSIFQYHIFCALTALGDYEKANAMFRQIIAYGYEARHQFQEWCMKYVFDTLEAGRTWHPPDGEPAGAAFLPMVEAEERYLSLSAKARCLTTDGFSAHWSPDGKKIAFSIGVKGYSGVAIFDPATKETELLIAPGKDPRWSPDGKYIAFVRDCQLLRLEELAIAEGRHQPRPRASEEVWIMSSDGTEPRLLARGSWPSWGSNSEHIYYQSRVYNALCSISIVELNAKPKQIRRAFEPLISVSPDNEHVSYVIGGGLRIWDLASKKTIVDCPVPCISWGDTGWSTMRNEVYIRGHNRSGEKIGLWVYDLDKHELMSVLNGQIGNAGWSSDGSKMAFDVGPPCFSVWTADLDPNVSTIEALRPGRTPDEHVQDMIALYSRRIEADPEDAYAYSDRAHYYDFLHEREKTRADMRRWSTILSGTDIPRTRADFTLGTPVNIGVFGTSPSVSTDGRSLFTDSLRSGGHGDYDIWVSTRETIHDDWPEPVNAGPPINSSFIEGNPDISADGLTLFFDSDRPGGQGHRDIWLSTRTMIKDPWSEPVNLGSTINSPYYDGHANISTDGLSLFFCSTRPGGFGVRDIWVSTRATTNDPWSEPKNLGPIVNSPYSDAGPDISSDGLKLFFDSAQLGGYGSRDIWVVSRATTDAPWSEPVNLGPVVNISSSDHTPCISADGSVLYFYSGVYVRKVSVKPVFDINADGKVDENDLLNLHAERVDAVAIEEMTMGTGQRDNPQPGGTGRIDINDIRPTKEMP